jgi:hypothetical protein
MPPEFSGAGMKRPRRTDEGLEPGEMPPPPKIVVPKVAYKPPPPPASGTKDTSRIYYPSMDPHRLGAKGDVVDKD